MQQSYRKIIHIDMDAFYTSVEQMDNPDLKGKPIVVGGSADRGVVAAASYEARKFGIKSAMSSVIAKKKCKNLIFIKPRFERYKEISNRIRNIFHEYTDLVEPLSLDEAFLDVTINKKNIEFASDIAKEIRLRIKNEIGITASAGISINKFTAKVATEVNKPDGQKIIHPENIELFLEVLPIHKFFGVGKVTAKKMNDLGIFCGLDLKKKSLTFLLYNFGKSGRLFHEIVRGTQDNPVEPNRLRKSIGAEKTFSQNLKSESFMLEKLNDIADELEKRMLKSESKGRTVTVKLKFSDFTRQTRSVTLDDYVQKKTDFFHVIESLLYKEKILKSVRLLGISISNLENFLTKKNNQVTVQMKFDF